MKHKKSDCVAFQEGSLPCDDCDLEGHEAFCNWHRDWHDCSCKEFNYFKPATASFKILDVIEQPDGTALVQLDLSEDFMTWFCEHKNIEKFDHDIFQEWFIDLLKVKVQSESHQT